MVFYVVSVSIYAILSLFIETIDLCMVPIISLGVLFRKFYSLLHIL